MHTLPAGIRVGVKETPGTKREVVLSGYVALTTLPLQQLKDKALYGGLSQISRDKIEGRVKEGVVKKVKEIVRGLIVSEESLISSLQQMESGDKLNENILILQLLKAQLEEDLSGLSCHWGEGVEEARELLHL